MSNAGAIQVPTVHPIVASVPSRRVVHMPLLRTSKTHDLLLRSIRRLAEWGVPVPPSSRIDRAEQLLRRWAKPVEPLNDPEIRVRLAEAIRTAVELHVATHGPMGRPDALLLEKCREILGGADLPGEEQQHVARDTQFELNVNGILAAGGFRPRLDASFGLRSGLGTEDAGVVVKRIWSQDRAHDQLSAAASQIEASGMRGIIATNVQQYLDVVVTGDQPAEAQEQMTRLQAQFPYLFGKKHVIGLLLCGTAAEWSDQDATRPPQLRISTFNQLVTIAEDRDHEATLDTLFAPFDAALRSWMTLNM
ncbi:MAG TPA: hypothetical protein VGM82_23490 [Gemmatimonadaceae bacterium]|jgi:hypothetical protein